MHNPSEHYPETIINKIEEKNCWMALFCFESTPALPGFVLLSSLSHSLTYTAQIADEAPLSSFTLRTPMLEYRKNKRTVDSPKSILSKSPRPFFVVDWIALRLKVDDERLIKNEMKLFLLECTEAERLIEDTLQTGSRRRDVTIDNVFFTEVEHRMGSIEAAASFLGLFISLCYFLSCLPSSIT